MKGYKAFNNDLTCNGMQYEIGGTYKMNETPIPCEQGFHFCKNIADCYRYYKMSVDTRICEVSAIGDIATDNNIKYCTNKIKIIREIKNKGIKHCNVDKTDVGYCNSGNRNSGDFNSGNRNSGDYNSGDFNSDDFNSGDYNSGDCNSGDFNSGNRNSGNYNSGNYNSGDYNSGNYNSGYCNTTRPKVRMFNHDTDMEFDDDRIIKFLHIMRNMPESFTYSDFIKESDMTKEEKEKYPEYKTIGGYTKNITIKGDKWKWWNEEISEEDKEFIKSLPYYDEDIFFESTGIKDDID